MKREIKRCFDQVQLSSESRQVMLSDILNRKEIRKHEKKPAWIVAGVLCAAIVVALTAVILTIYNNNLAGDNKSVTLSTPPENTAVQTNHYVSAILLAFNPSVEIRLDADGVVTQVVGLNEEGVALVEGIDFTGFSLENTTIMVVNQLILEEYITAAQIEHEINISLISDNITFDTLAVMTDIIKTAAAEHNIAVDVIENENENELQIVLEGQGNSEVWPELDPQNNDADTEQMENREIGIEVEFVMARGTYSAYVDNVLIHPQDGKIISNMLDFAGMSLNKAALIGIVELIEKELISDKDMDKITRIIFNGPCKDSDINDVASLVKLLLEEYDLKIAVTPDLDASEIRLIPDGAIINEKQASKYAFNDVLNDMVNKDENDLSPRQLQILKTVYNYCEYLRLFEKRHFVIIPDLTGMTEEKAIDLISRLGIISTVVREKIQGYDPDKENGGLSLPLSDAEIEQGYMEEMTWEYPVVGFNCVFYQDIHAGTAYQTGLPMQINVIVPENDERPEVLDFREDSGIVLQEMDVPFDVSGYKGTLSLNQAVGLDIMIETMDSVYAVENKADYTVIFEDVPGWEDTAVITIAHKDGFPLSKFYVQRGGIIEHAFVWRRDVPTREEGVPTE